MKVVRWGKFSIARHYLFDKAYEHALLELFSKVIVLRAADVTRNAVEYHGISEMFREIKESDVVPRYIVILKETLLKTKRVWKLHGVEEEESGKFCSLCGAERKRGK